MAWVGRKYKLATSENFDEYMKELGQYLCLQCKLNWVIEIIKQKNYRSVSKFKRAIKDKSFRHFISVV